MRTILEFEILKFRIYLSFDICLLKIYQSKQQHKTLKTKTHGLS